MNQKELDANLQKLEKAGLIKITPKENDDDTVIEQTGFGKWIASMKMEETYLSMPDTYQKVLRNAYEDPNGRFDPEVLKEE